jgi:RNA polymerase sigma-70 factor, ECF subfamily
MNMMPIAPAEISDALPDAELVALALAGRETAFALIMRRNNQRLFRMVRAILGNDAEAEDVVQETYLRAFAALDRWRAESSLATWLSRIALNDALAQVRRRRPTVAFDEAAEAAPSGVSGPFDHMLKPSPEALAAHAEMRRLLEDAIDRLPASFRVVFILREVEQLSVEETALALGIPTDTVGTRLFRARLLLRRALGRQLADTLTDTFPFAGARCDRIVAAVLRRLDADGARGK